VRTQRPALHVVSSFERHDEDSRLRVVSGSLGIDPRRGFVLYQAAARWFDQDAADLEKGRLLSAPPALFAMPGRSGPLRIVDSSRWDWVLEADGGVRAVLSSGEFGEAALSVLGRRLDPTHLPAIEKQGVAVAVRYEPSHRRAVLLVGHRRATAAWRLYGYLSGFSVPAGTNVAALLARPLAGPDGGLYRIDPQRRRLVRTDESSRRAVRRLAHPGCSSWPQPTGGRYAACPWSVAVVRPDGSRRTLLRRKHLAGGWGFLAPSPDGRTLLLERDEFGCGVYPQVAFLPVRGGGLESPVQPSAEEAVESEPLGWLRDGSALIAVQRTGGCEGVPRSGIYRVWPGGTRPMELVVETSGTDATTWGTGS